MSNNIILNTDSYKQSHYKQYPKGTTHVFSYIESRGGDYDKIFFFGLQMFIKQYLTRPVTMADVEEAKEIIEAHGEPFNYEGWKYIVDHHWGKLPVLIRAVPEGTYLDNRQILVSIVNTDPKCFWLPSFLETALLRSVWYPSTVATTSFRIRKLILKYLEETGTPEAIDFKLHDFGARGVSSEESAQIGGLAHLATGAMGTDTISALVAAKRYYGAAMAGFSIPAAEHSTMTCLGREGEVKQFENMIDQFAGEGKIYACVSDGYDIYNAVENIWGETLKEKVIKSGGTLVVRPDSGDPVTVVTRVVELLDKKFGSSKNAKGFKVLHPSVRVIQGDGVNETSINAILMSLQAKGYSADCIAFGMGGALLQAINRDTCKWAMKCSAIEIDGEWVDVFKDPVTDKGKQSKKGRLELIEDFDGTIKTVALEDAGAAYKFLLRDVYRNGLLLIDETLDTIRARANK